MSDRKISYVNKDFADFREALVDFTKQYYPEISDSLNDASVGSWLMDIVAGVSDSLSYHIDRAFQETNINTAQQTSSLYNLARNNGVKIPGPKGAVAEFKLTCIIPVNGSSNSVSTRKSPDWSLAPIVKRGSKFTNGSVIFELDHNVDFSHAFDVNGVPNRTIEVVKNSNDVITGFRVSKFFVLTAGTTGIHKQIIEKKDAIPFKEILLTYDDVMSIESIIFKEGIDHAVEPTFDEFMQDTEYIPSDGKKRGDRYRFFEVDSLIQPYRWGKVLDKDNAPIMTHYGYVSEDGKVIPTSCIAKGEWKPLRQKFMTEYTDKGYMKIIFGAGHKYITNDEVALGDAAAFSKHLITKLINNESLGVTPKPGTTMYILYKMGAGSKSNLPKDSVNKIQYIDVGFSDCRYDNFHTNEIAKIKNSFTVTNTTPAISGRDMLSGEELRNYIKYNKGAQDRCVTLNDYRSRIMELPSIYGSPYRVGVTEENNKIMIYLLGLDYNGKLTTQIPTAFAKNLEAYLSEYRMINDFVEMKAGRIINVSFEIDCYINKSYNSADVVSKIINKVKEYMNIDKHQMGDDIFLGDLEKEISLIDGVKNLIDLRVYNEYGGPNYSTTQTTQQTYSKTECYGATDGEISLNRSQIDLAASDHILYSENDTMIEIKYPEQDIRVRVKLK